MTSMFFWGLDPSAFRRDVVVRAKEAAKDGPHLVAEGHGARRHFVGNLREWLPATIESRQDAAPIRKEPTSSEGFLLGHTKLNINIPENLNFIKKDP
jgi:hypothetical protein